MHRRLNQPLNLYLDRALALTIALLLAACQSPASMRDSNPDATPNALIHESSPYLRQHAYNPVDWKPWSEAAWEEARAEDKLVIVSIGYSACHWCHVMEHESFEDPETAELMNRSFVCIKVDREERPDVDQIYMDAQVRMHGQGGWPLNMFCTPDGRPFYGGTYFPPEPRQGMPAFRQVLEALARAYREEREDVRGQELLERVDLLRRGRRVRAEVVELRRARLRLVFLPREVRHALRRA